MRSFFSPGTLVLLPVLPLLGYSEPGWANARVVPTYLAFLGFLTPVIKFRSSRVGQINQLNVVTCVLVCIDRRRF
jgi:hypothetical protein